MFAYWNNCYAIFEYYPYYYWHYLNYCYSDYNYSYYYYCCCLQSNDRDDELNSSLQLRLRMDLQLHWNYWYSVIVIVVRLEKWQEFDWFHHRHCYHYRHRCQLHSGWHLHLVSNVQPSIVLMLNDLSLIDFDLDLKTLNHLLVVRLVMDHSLN